MGVYQVGAKKSPWVKLALQHWGRGMGGLYFKFAFVSFNSTFEMEFWNTTQVSLDKWSFPNSAHFSFALIVTVRAIVLYNSISSKKTAFCISLFYAFQL
jgi:hypothetical protein